MIVSHDKCNVVCLKFMMCVSSIQCCACFRVFISQLLGVAPSTCKWPCPRLLYVFFSVRAWSIKLSVRVVEVSQSRVLVLV